MTDSLILRQIMFDNEEYQVLRLLVDNAWKQADDERMKTVPDSVMEHTTRTYQRILERIQDKLRTA